MTASAALREAPERQRIDVVTTLSVFIFLLIAIPSRLIVGPLGSAGTPAEILCIVLLAVWLVRALHLEGRSWGPRQPVRIMMALFVLAVLLSYIAANLRPMLGTESRSNDAGLLLVASWLGVLLIAMDGVSSRHRLDVLLRRLVMAAGALATLGLLQFVSKMQLTNYIEIPGLSGHDAPVGLGDRAGLARPAGTAIHPIEFGAVLTMCLPFALHYALTDVHRTKLRRWYPVAAIAAAVPISISRSAILSAAVVLAIMVPTWAPALRRRAYLAVVGLLGLGYITTPGLIGTLTSLFTGLSEDSSAQSRTDSFTLAFQFIGRTPIFGRGFQTFLPSYRILDDQYLGLLIDTGIFGLLSFLGLLVAGIITAIRMRRASPDAGDRSLAVAFAASVASALVSFAIFDAFSFPMATSLLFLLLGCVGALYRLQAPRRACEVPLKA